MCFHNDAFVTDFGLCILFALTYNHYLLQSDIAFMIFFLFCSTAETAYLYRIVFAFQDYLYMHSNNTLSRHFKASLIYLYCKPCQVIRCQLK